MKKIIFILSILSVGILIVTPVFAEIIVTSPGSQPTSLSVTNPIPEVNDVATLTGKIINFLIKLAIPITAILIVYAGFLYITSAGNEEKVKTAQKALIWAIVGFAVVLIASSVPAIIQEFLSGESTTTAPIIDQEPESSPGPGLPSSP